MEKFQGITLLGLGNGTIENLTRRAWDWMTSQESLYFKLPFDTIRKELDETTDISVFFKERGENYQGDELRRIIINEVVSSAIKNGTITYVLPGSPLIGNLECNEIIFQARENNIDYQIIDGVSYVEKLLNDLNLQNASKVMRMDTGEFSGQYFPPFPPNGHILLENWETCFATRSKKNLLFVYPPSHPVKICQKAGLYNQVINDISLENVDQMPCNEPQTVLYIPPLGEDSSFESFQDIVAHLRAPDGCPWDRKQTHESLKTSLLEETYETLAALDEGNVNAMAEEFGDLLLQIVLHAQIASEAGTFNMVDILQGIHRKLVRRHPHVFSEKKITDVEGVLKTWEELKAQERKENGQAEIKGLLDGVPLVFPALTQAQEYQKRAHRVGFDWQEIDGVWQKVFEELDEIKAANDGAEKAAEIGDLLFAVVNLARWMNVDAESSLRMTNQRFRKRFKYIENAVKQKGLAFGDLSLAELDVFWDEAKEEERSAE